MSGDPTRDPGLILEHCDPEVLALRALGEPAGRPEDDAHLATCSACRDELAALSMTADTGRSSGMVGLDTPSPHVWQRIQGELGLPAQVLPRATTEQNGHETRPVGPATRPADPGPEQPSVAPVHQLPRRHAHAGGASRRRRRVVPLLVAASLVGAVAGIGGTVLVQRLSDDAGGADTVLAQTPLDPLPSWQAGGSARVVEAADGERTLELDISVEDPTETTGFREVWLIDRDVSRLVSLGVLQGDSGSFVLPEGVDLAEYPVVDVSLEPYDGQPAHSGDSIVRGILPT